MNNIFEVYFKYSKKTSEKHEVYFDVFHSEETIYSKFTSNIVKTSQKHEAYFDVFHSEWIKVHFYFRRTKKDLSKER